MSSGKTANYELNQWVKSDQILMEDFNEDNAKIDAALKMLEGRLTHVFLREITSSVDAMQVDIDVSDIDWSQYRTVEIVVEAVASSSNYGWARLNGLSGDGDYKYRSGTTYYSGNTISAFSLSFGSTKRWSKFIFHGGVAPISGTCQTAGDEERGSAFFVLNSGLTYDTLSTLNLFVSSGVIKAGAKIQIYGVSV